MVAWEGASSVIHAKFQKKRPRSNRLAWASLHAALIIGCHFRFRCQDQWVIVVKVARLEKNLKPGYLVGPDRWHLRGGTELARNERRWEHDAPFGNGTNGALRDTSSCPGSLGSAKDQTATSDTFSSLVR